MTAERFAAQGIALLWFRTHRRGSRLKALLWAREHWPEFLAELDSDTGRMLLLVYRTSRYLRRPK